MEQRHEKRQEYKRKAEDDSRKQEDSVVKPICDEGPWAPSRIAAAMESAAKENPKQIASDMRQKR